MHWIAYLWPGLPHLWMRGSWAGLALAVGFTALLNTLLATSLVWNQWLPLRVRWMGGAALAAVWILAWLEARADWRRLLVEWSAEGAGEDPSERSDRLYREAQRDYLAGDWIAAEQTLLKLLKQDARDVEARLALATLWRRQRRFEEATASLEELARLEPADAWRQERARERELLQTAQVEAAAPQEPEEREENDAPEEREQAQSGLSAGRRAA